MNLLSGRSLCDVARGEVYGNPLDDDLTTSNSCEGGSASALSIGAPYSAFIFKSAGELGSQVILFNGPLKQVIALVADIESGAVHRAYLLGPKQVSLSTLEALDLSSASSI